MCGIAGQISLAAHAPVDADEVVAMVRRLIHRGPDDEGFFIDPRRRVGLGMRRLAIIDLVSGQQPVFNEDRSVLCVFNGEIYNFQELRRQLERKGHRFRSNTDTEAIVHLYEEEGVASLGHLRGMFALAIWDGRTDTLVLARDRLGKKPLYYGTIGDRLSFASEIGALLDLPGLKREIDPVALDLYLTYSYVPSPYSIIQGLSKLPPAHVMVVHDGSVDIRPYWRLEPSPPWDASRQELTRAVRDKLAEAVKLRLITDVPLGCFLSGGLDSSSVVALLATYASQPIKTFSIGFTYERFNELGYARAVADRYKTDHHEYLVTADAVAVLPDIVRHFGEPYGDASAVPTWYVSQLARRHVTVALNGDGGDELFAGYPWYRSALTIDRIGGALPPWASHAMTALPGRQLGRIHRLGQRLQMTPAKRFRSLRRFLDEELKQRLYSPRFLKSCGSAADEYLVRPYESGTGDSLSRMQYTDLMTYLPEDLLVKVDRMTMAHSVEGRSPLLDHEFVEFCVRLPSAVKIAGPGPKAILREAVRDLLPAQVLNRPKMGFSVPAAAWLRTELKERCYRKLCGGALMDHGWFEASTVRTILDEHMTEARDWNVQLWNLLMLAEWAEMFAG